MATKEVCAWEQMLRAAHLGPHTTSCGNAGEGPEDDASIAVVARGYAGDETCSTLVEPVGKTAGGPMRGGTRLVSAIKKLKVRRGD